MRRFLTITMILSACSGRHAERPAGGLAAQAPAAGAAAVKKEWECEARAGDPLAPTGKTSDPEVLAAILDPDRPAGLLGGAAIGKPAPRAWREAYDSQDF